LVDTILKCDFVNKHNPFITNKLGWQVVQERTADKKKNKTLYAKGCILFSVIGSSFDEWSLSYQQVVHNAKMLTRANFTKCPA